MSQLAKQKRMIADTLRRTIQGIEEAGSANRPRLPLGIPAIDRALPGGGLRLGGIHEVVGDESATGFCAALLARVEGAEAGSNTPAGGASSRGALLWLARGNDLYAPGLVRYGIGPGQLLVVSELRRQDDMLWAMEEALRCRAVSGVVAEIGQIGLIAGRRLMLAAEGTGVLGLVLSRRARGRGRGGVVRVGVAVSRWRVTAVPSRTATDGTGLPGQGSNGRRLPETDGARWTDETRWRIELLHCRGGRPAEWTVSWNSSSRRSHGADRLRDVGSAQPGTPRALSRPRDDFIEFPHGGRLDHREYNCPVFAEYHKLRAGLEPEASPDRFGNNDLTP